MNLRPGPACRNGKYFVLEYYKFHWATEIWLGKVKIIEHLKKVLWANQRNVRFKIIYSIFLWDILKCLYITVTDIPSYFYPSNFVYVHRRHFVLLMFSSTMMGIPGMLPYISNTLCTSNWFYIVLYNDDYWTSL